MLPRLLTVPETSAALGIKNPTVRKWIALRRIEFVRVGRSVRIPLETVERLIREGTVPPLGCR
ncbi:MAG: excisionase family DNA-binding protein [Terriglobales bacterium]